MNRNVFFTLSVLLFLDGCSQFRTQAEQRAIRAADNEGDISVGVVWPFEKSNDGFKEGVELARDEINQAGGVNGQLLNIVLQDDHNDIELGKKAAQTLANDINIVAVIGHLSSNVGRVTSLIYEYANLVFICPGNTSSRLSRKGFERIFRTLPSETEIGQLLADKAKTIDGAKILLVYQNDEFGRAFSNAFESKAEELRLRIYSRIGYEKGDVRQMERALKNIKNANVDSVVLGTDAEATLNILKSLEENAITKPVLVTLEAEKPLLVSAQKLMKGVQVASVFDLASTESYTKEFVRNYGDKYGREPTLWAAQGYDSVRLLHAAMMQSKSGTPEDISDALRGIENWKGVTGSHSFDKRGQVKGKSVFFKKFTGKTFGREDGVRTSSTAE